MKKHLLLPFFLLFFLFFSAKYVNAACTSPGGCFSCQYNTPAGLCEYIPGTGSSNCAVGYAPDPDACSNLTDQTPQPNVCNQTELPCVTNTSSNFFCQNNTNGLRGCAPCTTGSSSNSNLPKCPNCDRGNCPEPVFDNYAQCAQNCNQIINQNCISLGGSCQESCGSSEADISNGTTGCPITGDPNPKNSRCCRKKIFDHYICTDKNGNFGESSAIGCIPLDKIENTTSFLLARGAQLAGGIAFLFMLVGAFQLITSRGDPEKLISGRQFITSAVSGLLLLIFCVFVLKLIGIDILGVITK